MFLMQRLCLAVASFAVTLSIGTCFADDESGFRPIFDGQTLNGWKGEEKFWRVEDGAIVGESTAENPLDHNTFLLWDQGEVDDFELRLQFRLTSEHKAEANSGIQFRSQVEPGGHVVGYQADIDLAGKWVGALYDEKGRGSLASFNESVEIAANGEGTGDTISVGMNVLKLVRREDWNDYTIVANGERLTLKINGAVTAVVHDREIAHRDLSGLLALQLHSGPAQKIEFRNIRLKRLPLADGRKKVVFIAGKPSHGAGQHEHNAGCRLLAMLLNRSREAHGTPVIATVYQNGWPQDPTAFDNADTVVSYCDGGQGHYLNQHLEDFDDLVKDRGMGLVCIHYAVETTAGECGDHFLKWIGGFFEPHWSVNPHWTPNFKSLPDHPIARGVSPFEINDEWYYHMRFQPELAGVTPILTDLPTSDTLTRPDGPHSGNPAVREAVLVRKEPQHVAWAYERPEGKGRGFGFTGGHFHRNWADDNFRTIVTNAILWTAGADVPEAGVPTDTPTADEMAANLDPKTAEMKPQPKPTAPPSVSADERAAANALANLDVHPDLTATLFAAEPLLLNPTDIDIDHRGRVWACEVINYRRFANSDKPERTEGDRILILEDTDADGRADKTTTFYQGRDVDSAHGICVLGTPDDKGTRAIVSCGPEVFFLIDDDGDLKADRKELLFTGIAGTQHDHGIHAFVFGPDGKLYFNFGNAGEHIKDKHGQPIIDKAGHEVAASRKPYQEGMVFRCNTDGSDLETLAWNFRNNWEVAVDSFGALWQSDNDDDGNRGVRINFVMEYGNYGYKDEFTGAGWQTPRTGWEDEIPQRHWHLNDPGVVPNMLQTGAGSPTGICVYEGDALPEIFRGALIHTDAGPNICRSYVTKPNGAGFTAEIVNILDGAARDKWFRPSDVCVAPDGSLLVADWYDPGVGGHRMGDVEHGRIFRLTAKDSGAGIQDSGKGVPYQIPTHDFSKADGAAEALKSPNLATRYVAFTALRNMGPAAEPALMKLYESRNARDRARALWLLTKLGLPQQKVLSLLKRAISDPNVDIRCTAIRAARQQPVDIETPVLEDVFHNQESSPAVQREYLIALRESKDPRFAQAWAIVAAFGNDKDRWFLEALGIAADGRWDECLELASPYFSQLSSEKVRNLVWRSRGTQTPALLTTLIFDKQTPDSELPRLFRAFDFQADSLEKAKALTTLAFTPPDRGKQTPFIQAEALQRLQGFDISAKPEYLAALNKVLDASGDSEQFVRLVGKFSVADRYAALVALARRHANEQIAIETIRTLLDKDQLPLIRAALDGEDPVVADEILTALATAADARTVDLLLATANDADRSLPVRRAAVKALGTVRSGGQALQKVAESGEYDPLLKDALAATLHTARWKDIKDSAVKLFPLPAGRDSEPVPTVAELLDRKGDVAAGRIAFHSTGTCAKCHVVNGIGLNIGPELSEIGKKLSKQAMFESILFPSAAISHNFETWVVLDASGNITSGLLVSETDDELQLKDEKGLVRTIKKSDIDERRKQEISLMPADLHKILSVQELVDIVEFMSTLQQAQAAAAE